MIVLEETGWRDGRLEAVYRVADQAHIKVCGEVVPLFARMTDADREHMQAYADVFGLCALAVPMRYLHPDHVEIACMQVDGEELELWRRLHARGLAETAFRRGLATTFTIRATGTRAIGRRSDRPLSDGALLLNSGGRATAVAYDVIRRVGLPFVWFTCRSTATPAQLEAAKTFVRLSGKPGFVSANLRSYIKRRDEPAYAPLFDELSPPAAFAPLLVLACAAAERLGARHVLAANAASANEGNLEWNGEIVNHQYNQSYEFERAFADYVRARLNPELRYASPLMPLRDIQISQLFCTSDELRAFRDVFVSCNQGERWCGRCAKCAFVFALLHAFVGELEAIRIVGADLFARPEHVATYRQLTGLEAHKPLDGVGSIDEARLALAMCERIRRRPSVVLTAVAKLLGDNDEIARVRARLLAPPSDDHGLDPRWVELLREALARA